MAIDISDLEEEVTIYYTCPVCGQVSGIIINEEPFDSGYSMNDLWCCEHCDGFSEVWILPSELASKIRRMIKENKQSESTQDERSESRKAE